MKEGTVPQVWKNANVTPVHKNGSKNDVTNYRPISLLTVLSKVLERLVHKAIYPSLHKVIIPEQHGFVSKRSTLTNLVIFTSFLFHSLDNREQVDCIYTDFSKAFDKVDHELLLKKIAFNGIRGNLLRWFSSYITNRTQKVVVNGYTSSVTGVTSGVPQGSILGPLLFVLFINDVNHCFKYSKFLLYADDLKVFSCIRTINDCCSLQDDLDRLSAYCARNRLQLSAEKCKSITFTKKVYNTNFNYYLHNTPLSPVSVIRDLGIYLDSKLHLDQHVNHITNRAFQLYGFVMRTCCSFKRSSSYIYLYKTLIRSQLEYCTPVWNPYYTKYIDQIEAVQRKFIKSVNYKCFHAKSTYCSLLSKFSLPTLKVRRSLMDQRFLYNTCHNRYDCNALINQVYIRIPSHSQRIRDTYSHKLFVPKLCRTVAGERVPLNRVMRSYNDHYCDIDIFALTSSTYNRRVLDCLMDG